LLKKHLTQIFSTKYCFQRAASTAKQCLFHAQIGLYTLFLALICLKLLQQIHRYQSASYSLIFIGCSTKNVLTLLYCLVRSPSDSYCTPAQNCLKNQEMFFANSGSYQLFSCSSTGVHNPFAIAGHITFIFMKYGRQ